MPELKRWPICQPIATLSEDDERIRRLKNLGYIKRIVAIVDRRKIDRNLIAFSQVLLNDHAADTLRGLKRKWLSFQK